MPQASQDILKMKCFACESDKKLYTFFLREVTNKKSDIESKRKYI